MFSRIEPDADRSQIRSALEEVVCADPDVAFGSRLLRTPTRSSDLDIAVNFSADLSEQERFGRRCFLSGDLQGEDRPFIHVPDIESLLLDVAHNAVNDELLCGNEAGFERFNTDTEARLDEQCETLRRRQRAVIDRIAKDRLRG